MFSIVWEVVKIERFYLLLRMKSFLVIVSTFAIAMAVILPADYTPCQDDDLQGLVFEVFLFTHFVFLFYVVFKIKVRPLTYHSFHFKNICFWKQIWSVRSTLLQLMDAEKIVTRDLANLRGMSMPPWISILHLILMVRTSRWWRMQKSVEWKMLFRTWTKMPAILWHVQLKMEHKHLIRLAWNCVQVIPS